jgi:hypothetical protein
MRTGLVLLFSAGLASVPGLLTAVQAPQMASPPPARLTPFFRSPALFADDLGAYPSPLMFADGTPVKSASASGLCQLGARRV